MTQHPLIVRLLLLDPKRVAANLERAQASGLIAEAPNLWQVSLGVLRMIHRMLTRPESIGLSRDNPVRPGLRARLMRFRPLRFPFVLGVGAVQPWDLSGMLATPEKLIRHLVGTHHDRHQFAYDLQILSLTPGALERLVDEARIAAQADSPRAQLYQDLCVFQGYHDNLLHAAERAVVGDFLLTPEERDNPDISFAAYLRWCHAQPRTPRETWSQLLGARRSPPAANPAVAA